MDFSQFLTIFNRNKKLFPTLESSAYNQIFIRAMPTSTVILMETLKSKPATDSNNLDVKLIHKFVTPTKLIQKGIPRYCEVHRNKKIIREKGALLFLQFASSDGKNCKERFAHEVNANKELPFDDKLFIPRLGWNEPRSILHARLSKRIKDPYL